MPKLIGKATTVVDFEGLKIDELAGNVATSEDTISIARVTVDRPTSEPWLTLHYDEWICILKGTMELHYYESSDKEQANKKVLTATAGQTIMIASGERFRPIFPLGDCEYIPVCLPAFKPERCIREEETSEVSDGLEKLHAGSATAAKDNATESKEGEATEIIYHMCEKALWEKALAAKKAYYPPTFEQDGYFTHATGVPSRLLLAANHFYTSSQGDWICVELSHSALQNIGIVTKFEEAKAVGDTDALTESSDSSDDDTWIYPHIFGGIPAHIDGIVTNIFPMKRDEKGSFLSIEGL